MWGIPQRPHHQFGTLARMMTKEDGEERIMISFLQTPKSSFSSQRYGEKQQFDSENKRRILTGLEDVVVAWVVATCVLLGLTAWSVF